MEERNGFVFYSSFWKAVKGLPDEQRLKMYDIICQYGITGEVGELDAIETALFTLIKPNIDANMKRYHNGKQGGRPKAAVKESKEVIQDKPAKNADKEDALNADCDAVIDYLNTKAHRKFSHSDTSRRHVRARLADGFSVDDCKAVIDKKCAEWSNDSRMQEYLRPETLFGSKFEGYLNQKAKAGNVLPAWAVPVEDREDTDLIKEFMKDHGE